jgi:hypothetical protein
MSSEGGLAALPAARSKAAAFMRADLPPLLACGACYISKIYSIDNCYRRTFFCVLPEHYQMQRIRKSVGLYRN